MNSYASAMVCAAIALILSVPLYGQTTRSSRFRGKKNTTYGELLGPGLLSVNYERRVASTVYLRGGIGIWAFLAGAGVTTDSNGWMFDFSLVGRIQADFLGADDEYVWKVIPTIGIRYEHPRSGFMFRASLSLVKMRFCFLFSCDTVVLPLPGVSLGYRF